MRQIERNKNIKKELGCKTNLNFTLTRDLEDRMPKLKVLFQNQKAVQIKCRSTRYRE